MVKYAKTTYLDEENVKRLDAWRAEQRPIPGFSEAIQFLMLQGLTNVTIVKKEIDKPTEVKVEEEASPTEEEFPTEGEAQ